MKFARKDLLFLSGFGRVYTCETAPIRDAVVDVPLFVIVETFWFCGGRKVSSRFPATSYLWIIAKVLLTCCYLWP